MNDSGLGDHLKALTLMPHHGETPMLMWTTVTGGATPSMEWTFRVPKAVVEDIGAIAPSFAASRRDRNPEVPEAGMPERPVMP